MKEKIRLTAGPTSPTSPFLPLRPRLPGAPGGPGGPGGPEMKDIKFKVVVILHWMLHNLKECQLKRQRIMNISTAVKYVC